MQLQESQDTSTRIRADGQHALGLCPGASTGAGVEHQRGVAPNAHLIAKLPLFLTVHGSNTNLSEINKELEINKVPSLLLPSLYAR